MLKKRGKRKEREGRERGIEGERKKDREETYYSSKERRALIKEYMTSYQEN